MICGSTADLGPGHSRGALVATLSGSGLVAWLWANTLQPCTMDVGPVIHGIEWSGSKHLSCVGSGVAISTTTVQVKVCDLDATDFYTIT